MREAVALLAVLPGSSPRARRFALEATQRRIARGMGEWVPDHQTSDGTWVDAAGLTQAEAGGDAGQQPAVAQSVATDAEKNAISKLADAAKPGQPNADAMRAQLVARLAEVYPWGAASWKPIFMGGWYAYSDVSAQASTTFAERHPGVQVATETITKTASDLTDPNRVACAAVPGATWDEAAGKCSYPIDAYKKIAVAVVVGLVAVGAGYVAISSYAKGRAMRANSPGRGRGRRNPQSLGRRRPRPPRYYARRGR